MMETNKTLQKWSANSSLFRVFNSAERTQELERLHTTVMDSVQKAMGIENTMFVKVAPGTCTLH